MPRMLPDGRRLGAHLPLATGLVKAADRAHEIGAGALQIWGDNPTAWRRRAEPPSDQAAFRERLVEFDIAPVAIHASYLVNLAGSEEDLFGRSVALLASELRAAPGYLGRFVNVHVGSHRGAGVAAGTRRLADGLALVAAEVDGGPDAAMIVLENSAGSGFALGTSVAELADILDVAAAAGVPSERLGVCLDTAHAWAAGIDVSDPAAIDDLLIEFDDRIGLQRLVMVHLNDSKSDPGSRLDRHEHLGAGRTASPACVTCCATRPWRMPPTSSRRQAWTWATTRSTSRGRTTSRRVDRCPTSHLKRWTCPAAARGPRHRDR